MVNVLKFGTYTFLFLFSNKMLVIRARTGKLLVRIANREELLLQKLSDLGLPCLSRLYDYQVVYSSPSSEGYVYKFLKTYRYVLCR